jgi:predicted enzyme related to lactoylglutathione lyase
MGKVVHFEIPAEDPEKTVSFFKNVFGWNFTKWGDTDYFLTESGPKGEPGIEGAVMKRNHPDQPVVNTIQVDDIDRVMKSISENGGEIVVPGQTIPGVGTHCYFRDPSGYIHGAMQPEEGSKMG